MSDEDISVWGDALDEQAEAEAKSAADDWGDALSEQAESEAKSAADDWGDALNEQAESEAKSAADDWGDALNEQAETEAKSAADDWGDALNEQADTEEKMSLKSFSDQRKDSEGNVDLDVLLDIPVTLQLEIGRSQVPIRSLLSYTQGSIVEMDRMAGEPLDLLVNGTLIAHGEVVVINDKFGVRLTDVISPQERIKKLK